KTTAQRWRGKEQGEKYCVLGGALGAAMGEHADHKERYRGKDTRDQKDEGSTKMSLQTEKSNVPGQVQYLNPATLNKNPAFSNVVVVSGSVKTVYVGGQDAV